MRFLDLTETFIYQSKPKRLIFAALAIALFKSGIWYIPNLELWRSVSLDPFNNPFENPNAQYLFWNWLSPFMAWRLGIHSEWGFFCLHLVFSILFTFTFIGFVWASFEERVARTALALFITLPVSATAYLWVGMDSVTLFLMMLILVAKDYLWLVLPVGILLGMQHFEQGSVAFAALTFALVLSLVMKLNTRYSFRWAATALLGVVLGKIALVLLFRHYEIYVNSGRTYALEQVFRVYLDYFYYHFQYILWSGLGVGWIVVAKFTERGKVATPFLVALCGLLFLLPFVGDQTRVFSIVSFPLVATYLLLNPDFLGSLNARFLSWVVAIWLIIPYSWIWANRPLVSVLPYDVTYILHQLFGWFHVPTNNPLWPL